MPAVLLPPGWCVGKLLPVLDMLSAVFMSFCVCSRGGGGEGGGVYQHVVGGGGVLPMFLMFFQVTFLCWVTSLIIFWGFGVPGELCSGAPFWVAP